MKTIQIKNLKLLIMGLCVPAMLSFSSCGRQEVVENDAVDVAEGEMMENNVGMDDGMYDNNEFSTSFTSSNRYKTWDTNTDGYLDNDEYNNASFSMWDNDRDNSITENEWNNNAKNFGMTNETWSNWDTNRDNKVDNNEFSTAWNKSNTYSTWDKNRDNRLEEREFSDGVFSSWDDNSDGFVEKDRYDANYNTYFGS